MSDKDEIKELFREKLQSHEVMPSKGVWTNVSASLTNSAVATSSGIGAASLLKVAAAVVGITGLGVATYFILQENENSVEKGLSTISLKTEEIKETKELDSQNSPDDQVENLSSNAITPPVDVPIIDDTEFSSEDEDVEQRNMGIASDETQSVQEPLSINSETEESQETETSNGNESITEQAVIVEEPVIENVLNPTAPEVIEPNLEDIEDLEDATIVEQEEVITLPNVFTPNNDGVNDYFEIAMSDKSDFQIIVINQSNSVVFQSNSVNFRWDGRLQSGDPAPAGNYVYFISAKTLSGDDFVKSSALRIEH
jgi:gliding motility-associated-like protein